MTFQIPEGTFGTQARYGDRVLVFSFQIPEGTFGTKTNVPVIQPDRMFQIPEGTFGTFPGGGKMVGR